MRNTKLKKGFTLTELVVVIAIIAILILVVVPTFNNIVKNAEGSAALSQAKDLYGDYVRANSKEGKIDNDLYIQVDEGYVHYIDGKPVKNEDESYVVNVLYVNDDLLDNKGKYVESPFKTHESIVAEFVKDFNSFSYKAGYRTYYKNISDYWKNYNTVVTKELVNINKNDVVSTVNIAQGFWEKSALDNKNYNFDKWSWLFEALGNLETETTLFKDLTTNKIIDENNLEIISQNITLFFLQKNETSWNSELNGELTVNPVIDCASVLFENYFKLIPRDVFLNNINVSTPIFNINFDLGGGEWHEDVVYEYQEGETVALDSIPVKEGYIFTGWYDGDTAVNELTMPGNDVNLTASWKTVQYQIHYDSGELAADADQDAINSVIQDFLSDYNSFTTKAMGNVGTSHTPDSFYASTNDEENSKPALFLLSSSYRDKWEWLVRCLATVANSNNSQDNKRAYDFLITCINNKKTYNYYIDSANSGAYAINYPTCVHAELRGFIAQKQYTKNSNFTSADYSSESVRNAILSYGIPEKYRTTYTLDNTSYTIESEDIVLPTLTKTGYLFEGWYNNDEYTGDKIEIVSTGTTGDMTLYAKWLQGYKANPSNLASVLSSAKDNDTIILESGTYTNFNISVSGIIIKGPNAGTRGQDARKNAEAIVNVVSNINGDNVVIDGVRFNEAIRVGGNSVTITNCYIDPNSTIACTEYRLGCIVDGANIYNLTISNNYINVPKETYESNTFKNQFMAFNEINTLTVTGNYITNKDSVQTDSGLQGMSIYTSRGIIKIENNEFHWKIHSSGHFITIAHIDNYCNSIKIINNLVYSNRVTSDSYFQIQNIKNSCNTEVNNSYYQE